MKTEPHGNNEQGYVIIEATVTLVAFLLVTGALVNLINIFTVHNRMQHALNAAVHEVAGVMYPYEFLHIISAQTKWQQDGSKYTKKLVTTGNQIIDAYNDIKALSGAVGDFNGKLSNFNGSDYNSYSGLYSSGKSVYASGKKAVGSTKTAGSSVIEMARDPHSTMLAFIYQAGDDGFDHVNGATMQWLASTMVPHFMEMTDAGGNSFQSANDYLASYGVKNVDYQGSSAFYDDGLGRTPSMVRFQCNYEIDVNLFMPFVTNPTILVVQCATTRAWTNGDGTYLHDYR